MWQESLDNSFVTCCTCSPSFCDVSHRIYIGTTILYTVFNPLDLPAERVFAQYVGTPLVVKSCPPFRPSWNIMPEHVPARMFSAATSQPVSSYSFGHMGSLGAHFYHFTICNTITALNTHPNHLKTPKAPGRPQDDTDHIPRCAV